MDMYLYKLHASVHPSIHPYCAPRSAAQRRVPRFPRSSPQYRPNKKTNRLVLLLAGGTSEETGSSGSDETGLLTRRRISGHGRGVTDVLVVSSSVGVVHRVHGHTSGSGPRVSLGSHGVVLSAGLEERLVDSSTTGDNSDDGSASRRDDLLGAGREPDSGLAILTVSNDGGVVSGGPGERSSVSNLLLDVADDGSLRALGDGEDVADVEGGLLSAVDERSGGDSLGGDEGLLSELVSVRVSEDDGGEGGTSSSVVDDVLDNTPDVTVLLGEVDVPQPGRGLVVVRVGLEDPARLSLCSDDSTHF